MSETQPVHTETVAAPEIIDVAQVLKTDLQTSPYEHMIVRDFIRPDWQEKMLATYPDVKKAGSFPLTEINSNPTFDALIAEMNGPDFRHAIEEKFSVSLEGKPTMFTVRGRCRQKDGKIHTDTESKIITVLLYMNPAWENQGGRLRLLRSPQIDDYATEVPPDIGTLLIFRRSDHSWHGHLPFEGPRRAIQMNWVTHQKFVRREQRRHRWSSLMKKLRITS